jgi:ABC-type dipeptide/oligopeptide/nickel transport system permease component
MTRRGRTISVIDLLVKERLPYTLLLFGVSNFVIFFVSLFISLYLFRKYEGLVDRLIVFLSPLSSIPSWLHGVFLVIIFCAVLRVLPYPRSFTRGLDLYVKHDVWLLLKYMILPAFPMAIMIYFIYTPNIWIILGVIILLSVFGNALKNFRAAFLQAKGLGYIEAAQVYSAGNGRIILRYMVPRIIPLLVPQLVALVPSYIFLEPTLAFVGVVDPYLPTWGKILMTGLFTTESNDAIYYMNLLHNPYLALEPIGLMFLTGLAFSLLGMALDRIFNPRLRSL